MSFTVCASEWRWTHRIWSLWCCLLCWWQWWIILTRNCSFFGWWHMDKTLSSAPRHRRHRRWWPQLPRLCWQQPAWFVIINLRNVTVVFFLFVYFQIMFWLVCKILWNVIFFVRYFLCKVFFLHMLN